MRYNGQPHEYDLNVMDLSVIATARFGLGARPGDLAAVAMAPHAWLLDQIGGPAQQQPGIDALPSTAAVLTEVQALRRERRRNRQSNNEMARNYGRTVRRHYTDQVAARYRAAVATDTPFHERLVHFWSNHFAVSADKQPLAAIAGLFEQEAIRPHVSGRFADMLLAVEQHPAMLLYLDNQRSIGPRSSLGRRANRRRNDRKTGLNENLAREILELHTLGVDGGYSQRDVTSLAKIITGWSIGGSDERGRFADGKPGHFEFREAIHEPGTHTVVGQHYQDRGVRQGEDVLRDLATHPATAKTLCHKLARHFVTDAPPDSLVQRMQEAYMRSGGALDIVYRVLIDSEESWREQFSKYKSPHDFVVSALRAFQHQPDSPRFVATALDLMGQAPWRPGSPAGWPDTAAAWGGADALLKRIEWANTVARQLGARSNPLQLSEAVLGSAVQQRTQTALARAESFRQGTTLLLASPEFQRR